MDEDSTAAPSPESPNPAASMSMDANAGPAPRARHSKRPSTSQTVLEWITVIVVAIVLAFLVRTFVFQTFYIPSGSMEPTLQIGERIIVSKLSYDVHSVHRGDIIVFHAPPAEATACADPSVKDLVKRVIGLPGETISSAGNTILINGKPLAQPWFPATPLGPPIQPTHIPSNSYFVMGDNRSNSCDSRSWGTLPGSNIIGHVVFKIWPLSQIGIPG
jgi:signal peptidase I